MSRAVLWACFGLVASCATAAAQSASAFEAAVVWAKPETPSSAMETELAQCLFEAGGVTLNYTPTDQMQGAIYSEFGTVGAPVAILIDSWIGSAIEKPKAQVEYLRTCMQGRGYQPVQLSAQEQAELQKQANAAQSLYWINLFYARPDFSARLTAAMTGRALPSTSRLPVAQSEPYAVGAIRIDSSSLTVRNDLIGVGQPILTGKAHLRTATLRKDVEFYKVYHFKVPAGTVMQQVVADGPEGSGQTYWCGPVSVAFPFRHAILNHCVWDDGNSTTVYYGQGGRSLYKGPDSGNVITHAATIEYDLQDSPTDLLEPLNLTLWLMQIGAGGVRVEARARQGCETVSFWSEDVLFDEKGRAVLPFWKQKLVLYRSGDQVMANLLPDGDGGGWKEANQGAVR